eukprot:2454423-Ditylum_brightwellii.AAC.1
MHIREETAKEAHEMEMTDEDREYEFRFWANKSSRTSWPKNGMSTPASRSSSTPCDKQYLHPLLKSTAQDQLEYPAPMPLASKLVADSDEVGQLDKHDMGGLVMEFGMTAAVVMVVAKSVKHNGSNCQMQNLFCNTTAHALSNNFCIHSPLSAPPICPHKQY